MTADGRHFLVATSDGVLRFDAKTVENLGRLSSGVAVAAVWPSPNGRWIHLGLQHGGYRIIDAATGATVSHEDGPIVRVAFSADGSTRFVARRGPIAGVWSVSAYSDVPGAAPRWTRSFSDIASWHEIYLFPDAAALVVAGHHGVVTLDSSTGTELRRATARDLLQGLEGASSQLVAIEAAARHGNNLFIFIRTTALYVLRVDAASLIRMTHVTPTISFHDGWRQLAVSMDGTSLYYIENSGIDSPVTANLHVHRADTLERITTRSLGDGKVTTIAFSAEMPCEGACRATSVALSQSEVVLGADAGTGSINVTVSPPTAVWSIQGVYYWVTFHRRFHVGSATLTFDYAVNLDTVRSRETTFVIARAAVPGSPGQLLRIRQEPSTAPPGRPETVAATVDNYRVRVNWSPPTSGGSPEFYVVEVGTAPTLTAITQRSAPGVLSHEFSSVPPGRYYARVRAQNRNGISPPSLETEIVVDANGSAPPGPPRNLVATVSGLRLTATWDAPTTGGPPQGYQLEVGSGPDGSDLASLSLPLLPRTFNYDGVPNGVYHLRVRATVGAVVGDPSNEVLLNVGSLPARPGVPRSLVGTVAGSMVSVSWQPASDGGAAANYIIEAGSGRGLSNLALLVVPSTGTTFSVSGVPTGTYYLRVRGQNAIGVGGASQEIVVVVQ